MTDRIGPRCPYTLGEDWRPVLAAVATARAAGRPAPATDWRCVREPHGTTGGEQHLAMPLGVTGRSVRFAASDCDPLPDDDDQAPELDPAPVDTDTVPVVHAFYSEDGDRECTRRLRNGLACGAGPYEHMLAVDQALAARTPRRVADPNDVDTLVELIDAPGTTCLHIADGNELLLLMPEGDDTMVEQATQALADLFPTVTFLVLQGVTGAIVMPPRTADAPSPGDTAAYEQHAAGYRDLTARRDNLLDQGAAPADLIHPIRPIPPAGYQPPRQA